MGFGNCIFDRYLGVYLVVGMGVFGICISYCFVFVVMCMDEDKEYFVVCKFEGEYILLCCKIYYWEVNKYYILWICS